jgi:hypothetical protein
VEEPVRTFGHFKPINSPRFLNDCHEYVFHFTKSGRVELDRLALGVPYQDKSNIARWSHTRGRDLRCRGNTWFVPYETIQSREKERPHPATFPVQLAEWCINLHGASRVHTMLVRFWESNSAVAAQNVAKKFVALRSMRLSAKQSVYPGSALPARRVRASRVSQSDTHPVASWRRRRLRTCLRDNLKSDDQRSPSRQKTPVIPNRLVFAQLRLH